MKKSPKASIRQQSAFRAGKTLQTFGNGVLVHMGAFFQTSPSSLVKGTLLRM